MNEQRKLSTLLESEQYYRWVLLQMLEFCRQPQTFVAVQNHFLFLLKDKAGIHTPEILLRWLEEAGGLVRIQVNGEGKWQTTSAAILILEEYTGVQPLKRLLSEKPEHRRIYIEILKFCSQPRKRVEIEDVLTGEQIIQSYELHPTYFIQQLENSGGLEWTEQRWQTTICARGEIE